MPNQPPLVGMSEHVNYYTFTLFTYEWPKNKSNLFEFLDWLLEWFGAIDKGEIITKHVWDEIQAVKKLTNQSWSNSKGFIIEDKLEDMIIFLRGKRSSVFDLFLMFINQTKKLTPEYLMYLDNTNPEYIEDTSTVKVLSFSVSKRFIDGNNELVFKELCNQLENYFCRLNCIYGYGTESQNVVSSPYQFICDNDNNMQRRIVDYDYRSQIETLFKFNLLSKIHVSNIVDFNHFRNLEDPIVKSTTGKKELSGGVVILFENYVPDNVYEVMPFFQNLFDKRSRDVKTYYLLFNGRQAKKFDSMSAIESKINARSVRCFPRGSYQFVETEITTAEEIRNRLKSLEDIIEIIYPEIASGKVPVQEYLVEFSGFYNKNSIYNRIQKNALSGQYLKVFYEYNTPIEETSIYLIFSNDISDSLINQAEELVWVWRELAQKESEIFGRLNNMKCTCLNQSGVKSLNISLDLASLHDEAITLLVMLADEFNEDRLLIPYLVMGNINIK